MATKSGDAIAPEQFVGSVVDGRYLILKKIGEGGIGAVYLAADQKMHNRNVVVKVLLENWLKDAEIRRKFEHEKEALSRLDHPGIISILDSGSVSADNPYFVMPYVEGSTLEEIINENGRLPFEFCATVIESLSDALSVAHSNGILHRDIKPENIIVTGTPDKKARIRLIDFGIARVFDSQVSPVTHVERSIGTVWYVAPEQLLGHLKQTAAADIYSLGVVAYVMLTGRRPFDPHSVVQMAELQRAGLATAPSAVNSEVSPEVDRIIARSLAYHPEQRFQDIADFGECLVRALRRLSIQSNGPAATDNTMFLPTVALTVSDLELKNNETNAVSIETRLSESKEIAGALEVSKSAFGKRGLLIIGGAAGLVFLASVFAFSVYFLSPDNSAKPAQPATVELQPLPGTKLTILWEIQNKSGRNASEESMPDLQKTVFENGDKIRLSIEASKNGNLYLFNEDYVDAERSVFGLLFPSPNAQNGFPQIDANKSVKTSFIDLTGDPGKEIVWVVWTSQSMPVFDESRINALRNKGEVKDKRMAEQIKLLFSKHSNENLKSEISDGKHIISSGNEEMILYKIELEHR